MRRLGLVALGVLLSVPAFAADKSLPVVAPQVLKDQPSLASLFDTKVKPYDIDSVPMLAALKAQGVRLFFLGERSGLQGFFGITADGVQIFYVTPDKASILMGGLFSADGKLITTQQMQTLMADNKELGSIMNEAVRQQSQAIKAGEHKDGYASLPMATKPAENTDVVTNKMSLPQVKLAPGERLISDMQAAGGPVLGANAKAPVLYMVVSPTCPYCRKTWTELRESVHKGQVRVKLILLGNGDPVKQRMSARLMKMDNPMAAWDKFVDGDDTALDGEIDDLHMKSAVNNDGLIDRWDIRVTPYISYRAKDGSAKIVQGRPDRLAALLTDVAP